MSDSCFFVEFGSACHLGVSLDTACVGVAKKLFQVDGLEKDQNHQKKVGECAVKHLCLVVIFCGLLYIVVTEFWQYLWFRLRALTGLPIFDFHLHMLSIKKIQIKRRTWSVFEKFSIPFYSTIHCRVSSLEDATMYNLIGK